LQFDGNNLCVQRLMCRAISASVELLVLFCYQNSEQYAARIASSHGADDLKRPFLSALSWT